MTDMDKHYVNSALRSTRTISGRNAIISVWDNVGDAVDDIINMPSIHNNGLGAASLEPDYDNWYGSADMSEAVSILRNGWSDHRETVENIIGELNDDPDIDTMRSKQFSWQLAESGDFCNDDLYCEGEAECMYQPVFQTSDRPDAMIRIVVNGSASSAITSKQIKDRGIVIAALVNTLQTLGRGIELWWMHYTYKNNGSSKSSIANFVKIKDSSSPLDLDDTLFVSAHASMLRRFGFALKELESHKVRKANGIFEFGGYGRPSSIDKDTIADILGGDVHISFDAMRMGEDYSDPIATVKRHLHGLNF